MIAQNRTPVLLRIADALHVGPPEADFVMRFNNFMCAETGRSLGQFYKNDYAVIQSNGLSWRVEKFLPLEGKFFSSFDGLADAIAGLSGTSVAHLKTTLIADTRQRETIISSSTLVNWRLTLA